MRKLALESEGRKCAILIGHGLLGSVASQLPEHDGLAIVTNPAVGGLYANKIGADARVFMVPDSEEAKSLETASRLYHEFADSGMGRESCVIGLGGGTVGDAAGFVAATYMRGISLVQVPTTLLAQVDSSVGGKTGVNLPAGKNLVGAFHQPYAVVSDLSTLDTLPEKHFRSGLAEVVKCGIISSGGLFHDLEEHAGSILAREEETMEHVVYECARLKAEMVRRDERDSGERIILNLGHTLGHALEASSDYAMGHGHAVSIGLAFACRVSASLGLMPEGDMERTVSLLGAFGLPSDIPGIDMEKTLGHMAMDKKGRNGKMRMVLPTGIGREPEIREMAADEVRRFLEAMQ